jgi:imidazolonepropionase-like amidohydrolase
MRLGTGLHGELSLLVESGLTPLEALRAATVDAAQVLGADQLGVIAAGRAADRAVRALRAQITVRSVT